MNTEDIKPCKTCGSTENKFQPKRRECIKCRSKRNNEILNNKNFYKDYYIKNKEKFLVKAKNNYLKKKSLENLD